MTDVVAQRVVETRHLRYPLLFVMLLAITVTAFAVEDRPFLRVIYLALVGTTLVFAMRASGERTRSVRIAEILSAVAVVVAIVELIAGEQLFEGSTTLLAGLLLAFVPVVLARRFARQREITFDTVIAVVCIYFVFGLLFSFAYATLDSIGTHPFFVGGPQIDNFDYVYFSFTTLTTTGFGDLTAGTTVGRAIAISEAFLGQVFLVTIVARLVSLWAPRHRTDPVDREQGDD